MNFRRWLITGGCGFIGRTLIHQLQNSGAAQSIRVLDNLSGGTADDLGAITKFTINDEESSTWRDGVELFIGDILDKSSVERSVKGADVVVHLAANTGVQPSIKNPRFDLDTNVVGTFNLLEASREAKVRKFIFASSGAPIGNSPPPFTETSPCKPISPYGASKLAGEAYCSAYQGSFGLETYALRFSNVYGPHSGKKGSVVAKFLSQIFNGECWQVNGSGTQTRDFIFSEDLVDAIIQAATYAQEGGLYQVATSEETTINSLIELLSKILEDNNIAVPKVVYGEHLPGDVPRNYADIRKSRLGLQWEPRTPLEVGLRKTVDWFVENNANDRVCQ
ncbi:NAD-dependent epimerase/dehydratase family protein [Parahaliea aestuarii]|uniref:NAD-dependent epimerase/dehydratase family protein n=1 Tax=Parahaliea aestuarii TaxID=1852021 RepID=UPI001C9D5DC6|nr:NAD-dependent epimerase/dehydratase family protein [Parahaliea aestuarii]